MKVKYLEEDYVDLSDRMRLAPEDFMETADIIDPKFKIIAEELSNPLGKKIIQLLSIQQSTTNQIATTLSESI